MECPLQIPIVSHLLEMKTTLTATISAVCADIKTRSKARMEESRRLKVSSAIRIDKFCTKSSLMRKSRVRDSSS